MEQITPSELKAKLDAGEEIFLLDVREQYEHDEFNIGGTLIPLGEIMLRKEEIFDARDKDVVVYCRSGNRSTMAQHLLLQDGFERVTNLKGGILAWQEMEASA